MHIIKVMKIFGVYFGAVTLLAGMLLVSFGAFAEEGGGHYQLHGDVVPIQEDGIHDPENDAVKTLQPPAEAMKDFPRDPWCLR